MRQALSGELQLDRLADFLATVDWANQESAPKAIRETLGRLEQFSTEYAENDLSEADYREQLLGILPASEHLQPAVHE